MDATVTGEEQTKRTTRVSETAGGVKVKRTKDKQKGIVGREWRGRGREEEEVD